jgi:TP901 family phage tail tape measure protein
MAKKFSIEAIFSARDRLSAPIAKIRGQLAGLDKVGGKALRGLDRTVDRGIAGLGKFSNALGIAGVVSLGALAFEMTNVMTKGAELEKMLIRTGSAFEVPARVGTAAFETLTQAARNVGKTTEFSAQQGAESLNSLATAGYSLEQSVLALPKVIDFASAASLELSQSSDIASDSLGAFGLRSADAATNAKNMGRVMDSLTRAAADSTTNVAELFEGIRMGGAFAATSGASLEQFVALQGVLANKGIKGAEAGTAIRNSFLHLTKQTREAREAMAGLGIKIAKTKDGSIDMVTTIGRFTKATAKLTRAKKAEAIATVFGAYTVGPFLSLMDAGEDTIRKFTANLEGATGVTREMAEAMRESKAAKIAKFFNIIEDVRLTVFEAIAPTVLQIADSIGKWVTANQALIGTKAGEWAATLKDNLPAIATGAERVAKAVAGFVVFSAAVKTVIALATVIGWLSTAFAWLEFTALLVGTTVGAVVWPILLIGAAIAGVVALAYKYWPEISGFFSKLADWAVVKIGGMWEWIKGAFATAKGFIVAGFEVIAGLATLVFAPHIAVVKFFIETIKKYFGPAAWAPIGAFFVGIWSSIVDVQETYFGLVTAVWGKIVGVFTGIWQGIADAFTRIMGPIFGPTLDTIRGVIDTVRTVGRMTLGSADAEGGAVGGARPGEAPQVISPQERAAAATAEATGGSATVDGKIVVEAKPGTKASVKKSRPDKAPSLVLKPSGAFP